MAAKMHAILAFLSISSSVASVIPTRTAPKLTARDAFEWTALGDSYASGIGAGQPDEAKRCFRYSEAYPRAIQGGDNELPDFGSRILNNVVCSGASTGDILAHQFADEDSEDTMYGKRPKFGNPKMATLSLGGNDIGLRYLLNSCVYNFYPTYYSCDAAIQDAFAAIDNPSLVDGISSVIAKTLEKGRAGPAGNDFHVLVAGYAQFFNSKTDQCSDVTWARPWFGQGRKLDKKIREDFNDMAIRLNQKIQDAVNKNDGAHFVDVDSAVEGHRYCEDGIVEPDNNNDQVWFWQAFDESDANPAVKDFDDAVAKQLDPSVSGMDELVKKFQDGETSPGLQPRVEIEDAMWNVAVNDPGFKDDGWLGVLTQRVRVFHPKKALHDVYAQKISEVYGAITNPCLTKEGCTTPPPTPSDLPLGDRSADCDGKTWPFLPNDWILSDGRHTMTEIIYRMRDQACQGLCETIQGVPGQFAAAVKDGNSCEYTVKVTNELEMYMFVSGPGQNCYDATAKIEDKCKNGQSGWINGPNPYEFYQQGVRTLNGDGAKHQPFSDNTHLGYNQMWCSIQSKNLADYYYFETVNFDDGNWGKSIQEAVHKNCGGVGAANQWTYEPTDGTYDFGGEVKSDHKGSFRSPWFQAQCTADTMSVTLGLPKGSITCS